MFRILFFEGTRWEYSGVDKQVCLPVYSFLMIQVAVSQKLDVATRNVQKVATVLPNGLEAAVAYKRWAWCIIKDRDFTYSLIFLCSVGKRDNVMGLQHPEQQVIMVATNEYRLWKFLPESDQVFDHSRRVWASIDIISQKNHPVFQGWGHHFHQSG
ncbi:MAG: hypothetical protein A2X82_18925 [Geobacteraceae bacterium GWC2_55_20]|nr:MAG: hypothetical protein A2X82_18925 [Geobacteraceae bacterium GWC2_55_20]OGU21220.1 MAG: hypothetical protein A2X85_02480 [Geobacteraceae bacterium GWF2_54_21]